jgi:DnaJ-class molecular chaperone
MHQITQTADTETIRAAYYGFMKQFYPEGSRRDPNDEFHRLLTHAYEVLTDSARRAGYDAALLYATRTEV